VVIYCTRCWKDNPARSKVCSWCGAKLEADTGSLIAKLIQALSHPEPMTVERATCILVELKASEAVVPGKGNEKLITSHQPYWVTENWSTAMSPVPRGLLERLLPRDIAIRRIKRWLQQDIESIVLRNIGNLQYETRQNIEDTLGRFSFALDQELENVAEATLGAIQEAHIQRTEKADSVGQELKRLADFESKMQELHEKLAKFAV